MNNKLKILVCAILVIALVGIAYAGSGASQNAPGQLKKPPKTTIPTTAPTTIPTTIPTTTPTTEPTPTPTVTQPPVEDLNNYLHTATIKTHGTLAGAQQDYAIPVLLTTGQISPESNGIDQGNVVTDNFDQWLQSSFPLRRYNDTQQPIIGTNYKSSWSNNQVNDQAFIIDGDMVRCYFEGVQISGSTWTKWGVGVASVPIADFVRDGERAIWTAEPTSLFEQPYTIRMGSIIKFTDPTSPTGVRYYLYTAEPVNGKINAIGVYSGTTYNSFTRLKNDIIPVTSGESFVQNPAVIRESATDWKMYYNVQLSNGAWAYNVATSLDGINWVKQAQVLTSGQGWDNQKLEHIHAMKVGDTYVLTYEAARDGSYNYWSTGIAYSKDYKGVFTKYSGNPVLPPDRKDTALASYGQTATPAWLKIGGTWYYSDAGNTRSGTDAGTDWTIELIPVNMPVIKVSDIKSDFSDVRFTIDRVNPVKQYRDNYQAGEWAKYYVQIDTDTPTYNPINVAAASNGATAQASSVYSGYSANGAIDGTSTEWASNGERTGAWLRVNLPAAKNLGKIEVCGRANTLDAILMGTITFSDGSKERLGNVQHPGSITNCRVVEFKPRSVNWFTITIDSTFVYSSNTGVSEVRAYEWNGGAYDNNTYVYFGNQNAASLSDPTVVSASPHVFPEPFFLSVV